MSSVWHSPADLAEQFAVKLDTVYHWIDTGQLRAINVTRNPHAQRRSYRIRDRDLDAFIEEREVAPRRGQRRRALCPSQDDRDYLA